MIEAERKKSEEKTNEQKKSWEEADDRAQGRIVAPEDENTRLTNEAAEREKLDHEREAARKASEAAKAGEQKRWEEEAQAEAKNATSKLEGEILNGRKLIEGLQSDKRRDRQLLLELRAQLVRPTHAVPLSHMNPHRFGGSAQAAYGAPFVTTSPAAPFTSSLASPEGTLLPILPTNPPQATHQTTPPKAAFNQDIDLLFGPPPPRPIIRLPPPPPHRGLREYQRQVCLHKTRPKGRKAGHQVRLEAPDGKHNRVAWVNRGEGGKKGQERTMGGK